MTALMSSILRKLRSPAAPLDLRGKVDDLREAWGQANGQPFLFDVPVAKIRAIGFVGSDPDNPFVVTLRDYAAGRCSEYKGSALEDFYRQWQPHRGSTDGQQAKPDLPWKQIRRRPENTPAGRLHRTEFREIARELGVQPEEIRGHIAGGPVTDAFGEVTFRRLARLYDSLARDGFRPDKSDAAYPTGACYLSREDSRVTVGSGKHRVTVMLALGWTKIPMELGHRKAPAAIHRHEVHSWPNVRSGRFSPEEALRLFDRYFDDRHPSGWTARTVAEEPPRA